MKVLANGDIRPAIAVDKNGLAHYTWTAKGGGVYYQREDQKKSRLIAPNGFWSSIALKPNGQPHIVWEERTNDSAQYGIFHVSKGPLFWNPIKRISTENYAELPDIYISDTIWVSYQTKNPDTIIVRRHNNGNWNDAWKVGNGLMPRIDKNVVVWQSDPPYSVQVSVFADGKWKGPVTISGNHKDQTPDVAVDSTGLIEVVWGRYDSFRLATATSLDGASWQITPFDDGGLLYSLWPKIAFNGAQSVIVFQGKNNQNENWAVYSREKGINQLLDNQGSNQTPAVGVNNGIKKFIWANSTEGTVMTA